MIHPLITKSITKNPRDHEDGSRIYLRPISRKYDKAEHEPPVEMEQLNQAAAAQKKESGWEMIL